MISLLLVLCKSKQRREYRRKQRLIRLLDTGTRNETFALRVSIPTEYNSRSIDKKKRHKKCKEQ